MSKSYLFEELECDENPDKQTRFERLQLVVFDHWKNILIGGLAQIMYFLFLILLTYLFTGEHNCERVIVTNSTLPTGVAPSTTKVSTSSRSKSGLGNYSCVDGFIFINSKCWKLVTGPKSKADADQACFNLGGSTLFSIRNEQDNRAVLKFVNSKNVINLWTGLFCEGPNPFLCTWDVRSGTTRDYNNFAEGNPNKKHGNCIYYMTTGTQAGQWASGSCNETEFCV